jgi:two-component system phosphate regulon sensor histidine kinase PhoR
LRPPRIFRELYGSYLITALFAIAIVSWVALRSIQQFYLQRLAAGLESRAVLARGQIADKLDAGYEVQIDSLCTSLGRAAATRITVISASGRIIGESDEDPSLMDDHSGRPEIRAAMEGRVGVSQRHSATLRRSMLYVAVPVWAARGGRREVVAVVRTAVPVTSIQTALRSVTWKIVVVAAVLGVVLAVVSAALSRRISRPLQDLREGAEEYARGRFQHRLTISGYEEIGALAATMNDMAAQLDEKIRTVTEQRSEQEAILRGMVEGVLAVDTVERVVSMNRACGRMLGVEPDGAAGRAIQEVVRNPDLQSFIRNALDQGGPSEGDVRLRGDGERHLQVHGAPLRDAQGQQMGVVVVLNDVTRLRRLEKIRRDFVANVSHELKSPVTSIKSAAETLLDGAATGQGDVTRFLTIIARQADRMSMIIEDLLNLSRLESTDQEGAELKEGDIEPVLHTAVDLCQDKTVARRMVVEIACLPGLRARIDRTLLEKAVENLVDNALTYSHPAKTVRVAAAAEDSGVVISVADHGYGIERKHLPRLFERFYRVDKDRSREVGGTGLGLAIVKHIAEAHGGSVSVESTPGEGSTFSIHLPPV